MAKSTGNDSIHVDTVECIERCQGAFATLLERQSRIFRDKRRSSVLTDRDVRKAYDVLLDGKPPHAGTLLIAHVAELCGGGLAAFGWHFAEDHPDMGAPALAMAIGGAALFALGIAVREFWAR